jgi:hypothetical protein
MPDRRPPQLIEDERATLVDLLRFQRESLVRKVEGLSDEAAASSPVPSGTSLLWLVQHLAWAEQVWTVERFAGRPVDPDGLADGPSVAAAIRAYRHTWTLVDGIVADGDLDHVCAMGDRADVNLRWILAHLLEETARHAGHADILRELADGSTGR